MQDAGQPDATLTTLVGRENELAQLGACHDAGARLVTLLGQGGMGKTLLARHALSRAVLGQAVGAAVSRRSGDQSTLLPGLLVDLSAVHDESGVLPAIAAAAQARTASLPEVARAIRSYELLVLDNFEQVLPAAPQVAALLDAAPNLRVLITSRERLNLLREHVLPLPGLSVQPVRHRAGRRGRDLSAGRTRPACSCAARPAPTWASCLKTTARASSRCVRSYRACHC